VANRQTKTVTGRDLRNTLAKVRDAFFESDDGERCCEGTAKGQYLRNRLETAFLAGARTLEEKGKEAIDICDKLTWQVDMGQLCMAEAILEKHAKKWKEVTGNGSN